MKSVTIHYTTFGSEFDFSILLLKRALKNLPDKSFGESIRRYDRAAQRWISLLGRQALLQGFRDAGIRLPAEAKWQVTENGRPYITGCPDFNISHSGKVAVCAIASGNDRVGIDVQAEKPMGERRLRQVLTLRELAWVDGNPRKAAFLWSRKEAISKLLGLGMRMSYRDLETLDNRIDFDGHIFYLTTIPAGRGYQCTLAGETPLSVSFQRYQWVSFGQLISSSSAQTLQ